MSTVHKSPDQAKPFTAQQLVKWVSDKDQDIDFPENPDLTTTDIKRGLLRSVGRGCVWPQSHRNSCDIPPSDIATPSQSRSVDV